jgi:hypothetical protein
MTGKKPLCRDKDLLTASVSPYTMQREEIFQVPKRSFWLLIQQLLKHPVLIGYLFIKMDKFL